MMKSIITIFVSVTLLALIFSDCGSSDKPTSLGLAASNLPPGALPQDVANTCIVADATFAAWFEGGKVTANGFVNPANSADFKSDNNCSFYRWSEQMLLWLTSSGAKYGGESTSTVMESPLFYTVSAPLDTTTTQKRALIEHKKGTLLRATADIAKMGTEEGQATNNVLLDKYGNIVYYITMVNNMYKVLLEMANTNPNGVTEFPNKPSQFDSIKAFAKQNQLPLPDSNVLAIELKTSWVRLAGNMKKEDYITAQVEIPIYDKNDPKTWVLKGKTIPATLALIGVHIVGSAKGRPEMIWSTFEHKFNTPNAQYSYVNTAGKTVSVAPDNSGDWVFNQKPQDTDISKANARYARFNNNNTITATIDSIRPSNTIRVLPWGCAEGAQPNNEDVTTAAANSQVLSMNNSVIGRLVGNDVRKNYIFIGSTWTRKAGAPTGKIYNPSTGDTIAGVAIGTSALANSTMETDFQFSDPNISKAEKLHTCFTCHKGTLDPKKDPGLSHIFAPLMLGTKNMKPIQLNKVK